MYSKVSKELNTIKKQLNDIIENQTDTLIDATRSSKLKVTLQKNVLDNITQTIEEIDLIFDDIYGDEFNTNLDYD